MCAESFDPCDLCDPAAKRHLEYKASPCDPILLGARKIWICFAKYSLIRCCQITDFATY